MSLEPDVRLAFLRDLEEASLEWLRPFIRVRSVPRRTVIFRQGDASTTAYIVVSGQIRITVISSNGTETTLDVLGRGDVFGVAGLAQGMACISNATSARPTRLLEIPTEALRTLMERHPAVLRDLLGLLLRRLSRSIQDQVAAGTQRVYARVAQKLLSLSGAEPSPNDERRLPAGLSHQDLASMIGSTRATVTRILQEMRRQGVVDLDPSSRQLIIREAQSLLQLAEAELADDGTRGVVFP